MNQPHPRIQTVVLTQEPQTATLMSALTGTQGQSQSVQTAGLPQVAASTTASLASAMR